jgi:hypothetical protein
LREGTFYFDGCAGDGLWPHEADKEQQKAMTIFVEGCTELSCADAALVWMS